MAKAGPTSSTPDAITQVQRHYNPEEDIVGRAEYLPEHQFKVQTHGAVLMVCAGLILTGGRQLQRTALTSEPSAGF